MMYLLRKHDVAPVGRSDVMFAPKTLGEAEIIHEVNIISEATSFAEGKHRSKTKSTS